VVSTTQDGSASSSRPPRPFSSQEPAAGRRYHAGLYPSCHGSLRGRRREAGWQFPGSIFPSVWVLKQWLPPFS